MLAVAGVCCLLCVGWFVRCRLLCVVVCALVVARCLLFLAVADVRCVSWFVVGVCCYRCGRLLVCAVI